MEPKYKLQQAVYVRGMPATIGLVLERLECDGQAYPQAYRVRMINGAGADWFETVLESEIDSRD